LQTLAPTNPHWARVVGYGPSSWVIHKEGLCPSNGDINRLDDDDDCKYMILLFCLILCDVYLIIDPREAGFQVALPLDGSQVQQVPAALKRPRGVSSTTQPHHRVHDPPVAFHIAL
jgi:hypothetical protein